MTIKRKKRGPLWAGIITAAISFVLLFAGIRFVLGSQPSTANILAYLVLSVILGIISYVLFLLRPLVSFYVFEGGLLAGFVFMYAAFENGMTGWSDLAGIMTFFICVIAGLGAGLLAQIIVHFIRKSKRRKG